MWNPHGFNHDLAIFKSYLEVKIIFFRMIKGHVVIDK